MPAIEATGLTKTFRTYKKQPGFRGAIKGLFRREYEQTVAVKDVSFKIEPGDTLEMLKFKGQQLEHLHFPRVIESLLRKMKS